MLVKQTGPHNRTVWMPSSTLLPIFRESYLLPDVHQSDNWEEPELSQLYITCTTGAENGSKTVPDVLQSDNCAGSIRLMIDDLNSSSSGEISEFPILEKILTAMNKLRGMVFQGQYREDIPWESLSLEDFDKRTPPKLALAWVVKAYGDRTRMPNPVGLVFKRLRDGSFRSLPANWQERLPGEYLLALGIQPPQAQQPPLMPATTQPAEQEPPQHPPEPPASPEPFADTQDQDGQGPVPKPNIFKLYEENIGPLTPMLADILRDAEKTYPESWARDAFEIAVKNNHRSWAYVQGVLKKWQENGRDWEPASTRQRSNRGNHQQQTQTRPARSGHGSVGTDSTNTDDDAAALEVLRAQADLAT
jgi:DnaD/phage-associated family protein